MSSKLLTKRNSTFEFLSLLLSLRRNKKWKRKRIEDDVAVNAFEIELRALGNPLIIMWNHGL